MTVTSHVRAGARQNSFFPVMTDVRGAKKLGCVCVETTCMYLSE